MTLHEAWTTLNVVNAASGALFIGLGAFVARVRQNAANRSFALFASTFGGAMIVWNLGTVGSVGPAPRSPVEAVAYVAAAVLFAAAVVGLVLLSLRFPSPVEREERPGLAAVAVASLVVWYMLFTGDGGMRWPEHAGHWGGAGYYAVSAALLGLGILFALRAPGASDREAYAYATMASALVLHPAFYAGLVQAYYLRYRWGTYGSDELAVSATLLVPVLVVAALWLRAAARSDRPRARQARIVAWTTLGTALAGALAAPGAAANGDHWGFGVARAAGVLVLAYAILRGQLLGIDWKVRWTISKSSVAAVFIAVFFVASEAAQQFFGETLGSSYVGILAAGALVFAIAPLSKLADRVAEKAVPVSSSPSSADAATIVEPRIAAYRSALRAALADGAMTAAEEEHLADVAHHLTLSPRDALRVRREVEREMGRAL